MIGRFWRKAAVHGCLLPDSEFTIVEVTRGDFGCRQKQLWIAAAKPDQAVTLVLTAVPAAGPQSSPPVASRNSNWAR
jgi:hypothetical protein